MYTIGWTEANKYYNSPYDELDPVTMGYQLHMFGKMTNLVKNIIPSRDSLYTNIIKTIGIELCKTHPKGVIWDTFKDMITILNNLIAPYNIHGGTLLSWYRDCSLGGQDIDFTLELEWFTKNNKKLRNNLLKHGWKMERIFGQIGNAGYEEAWLKNNIKVDLFSQTLLHEKYTNGLTINGITYPCIIEKRGTLSYKWGDLSMKVPVPIEPALKSLYRDWKTPAKKYVWDIDPFKEGNQCSKNFTL
jgi:hypothetical protein